MSKFLELVEENNPVKDIDALTDAKRSLQRLLMKSKIEAHGKAFEDILRVRLDDGRVVELEVKDVQQPVEDQETTLDASVRAAADQGDPEATELVNKQDEANEMRAEVVQKINKAYQSAIEQQKEDTEELEGALDDAEEGI
tara:strand:+ start:476 stop:898 length:423 start_codon:yes stop_codon:yes gene_type:complete